MNIKKSLSLIVAMAFAFTASAYASPNCYIAKKSTATAKKTEDGGQSKSASSKKPCCSKGAKAKTVAGKTGSKCASKDCSKGCAKGCSKGCAKDCSKCGSKGCGKFAGAKLSKTDDGVQVKTASTKKPCCSKGAKAKTVAGKKGCSGGCSKGCSKGCGKSGAKAKTVAGKKGCSKRCGKSGAKLTSSKPTCHKAAARAEKVDAILASLPSMTYKVGETETPCSKSANATAAASGEKIAYVVDGKSYEAKGEAVASLAGLMTEKYNEMSHVQFVAGGKCYHCPMTASKVAKDAKSKMKYRLAGFDFDSKDRANKVAAEVQEAMTGMKIKYMSEGKPVTCVKSCKKAGKKVTYVVGDQETECEQSAKLMLAEFIARSIVELVAESKS